MSETVGPVLVAGRVADAIVAAIRAEHPDVAVRDHGSYLRVLVAGRCVLRRDAVEAELGGDFNPACDLEPVMPSFKGHLHITRDGAEWS